MIELKDIEDELKFLMELSKRLSDVQKGSLLRLLKCFRVELLNTTLYSGATPYTLTTVDMVTIQQFLDTADAFLATIKEGDNG